MARIAASPAGDSRISTLRPSDGLADFVSRPLSTRRPTSVVTWVAAISVWSASVRIDTPSLPCRYAVPIKTMNCGAVSPIASPNESRKPCKLLKAENIR